jgi:hypothetical protein
MRSRNGGLYWGFLASTLTAGTFAATVILFIAIPSLPQRIHAFLAGDTQIENQIAGNFQQSDSSNKRRQSSPAFKPVNLDASDMHFLEDVFKQEMPEEGFDPALLEDQGELVLRRYRDASGRTILVVTESEPAQPVEDPDARVY